MQSLIDRIDARTTVLTVNRRLARALHAAFARARRLAGALAWETPDIVPIDAWFERTWLHSAERALLGASQERVLWERCIEECAREHRGEALLGVPGAARLARDAYTLLHDWQTDIGTSPFDDDVTAFLAWRECFERECGHNRWTTLAGAAARLCKKLPCGLFPPGASVVLAGFDLLTPRDQALMQALREAGVEAWRWDGPSRTSLPVRVVFGSNDEEIEFVARWARAKVEQGAGRIDVVIPDLARMASRVERIFEAVLCPGAPLEGEDRAARPFNLSLGSTLSRLDIVDHALFALRLVRGRHPCKALEQLVGSVYLPGAVSEWAARACLVARLRDRGAAELSLGALLREAHCAGQQLPVLTERLRRLQRSAATLPARCLAPEWAGMFSEWLNALGWPGDRGLDTREHQALEAFEDLLDGFARLDSVLGAVSLGGALDKLGDLAAERVFQPRSAPAPIEVMGLLESAGQGFDSLWVAGLDAAAWPRAPRPNPFLPFSLQRVLGMAHATPERELDFAERMTRRWTRAADEVVFSHAESAGGRATHPSPLISDCPRVVAATLAHSDVPSYAVHIHQHAPRLASLVDVEAPALAPGHALLGGVGPFRDQAACPFRAFARHRLHASALSSVSPGFDARQRGSLMHRVMQDLWQRLESQAVLLETPDEALEALVEECVAAVLAPFLARHDGALRGSFERMERERIKRVVLEWLAHERARAPFEVHAHEEKWSASIGGVSVDIRPDRIDRVAGGFLILDYKTGATRLADWFTERIAEPQLPLYCTALDARAMTVRAVAYGCLRTRETGFLGLGDTPDLAAGIATEPGRGTRSASSYADWAAVKAYWARALDALGREFAGGRASVSPRGPAECRYCEVKPLCRVWEGATLDAGAERGA